MSWNSHFAADIHACERHSPASASDCKTHSETRRLSHLLAGRHLFPAARLEVLLTANWCESFLPQHPFPGKLLTGSFANATVGWRGCEDVKHVQGHWTSLAAGGRTHLYLAFPWWRSYRDDCLRAGMCRFFLPFQRHPGFTLPLQGWEVSEGKKLRPSRWHTLSVAVWTTVLSFSLHKHFTWLMPCGPGGVRYRWALNTIEDGCALQRGAVPTAQGQLKQH